MIFVIVMSIIAVLAMIICILKFHTIRIGKFELETFYLPILIVALIFLIFPIYDKSNTFNILFSNSKLNPLKILILFFSISFISISLDEAGFFTFIAIKFINRFKKSQYMLFFSLYFLISILTIFTSNYIVILTFTPFILYFAKNGRISPIPYLVLEFICANTYSLLLPIGNPTNIYLSSIYSLNFIDYVKNMLIPSLIVGLVSLLVLLVLFRKSLSQKIEVFNDKKPSIKNKTLCIISLIHLISTTILLVISNYINLEMWIIALIFASSLLTLIIVYSIYKKNKLYVIMPIKRLPYNLLPFILSMFVIIMALESYDVFINISNAISRIENKKVENIIYLISSTLSCNIVNNIPMTIAYGSILSNTTYQSSIYMTIIGSNIGAILTPIGALAGIMWMKILKSHDVKYSFLSFMKNGSIVLFFIIIALSIYILI